MKKFYILLSAGLLSANLLSAQSAMTADVNPNPKSSNLPSVAAVTPWQVLYNTDLTAGAGAGNAGVTIVNNEYWISRWQSDSMFTYDMSFNLTASFTVPGVTGVRSFTTDGTNVYAGANTGSIFKIDPVAKTLLSTINTAVANVRYCTYDPTANSGAGGFWVGTWDTDFTLVSMTGTTLTSLSALNHGLTATYGLAYDGSSPGGPYLWAFHQTDAAALTAADLIQIEIATGFATGVIHDVTSDFGTPGDLAGGVYFTNPMTLVGILQGTPNYLFGYDVNLAGIKENAASPDFVSAYPNPVTDMVNIGVKRSNNDPMNMQIMNIAGKVVFESSNVGVSNYVNMAKYPAGVYTVKVTHNGQAYTSRIVRK
jgi:hypothetical protein